MNCVKISEAEYPLMEYIWEHAPISASALAAYSQDAFHWKDVYKRQYQCTGKRI